MAGDRREGGRDVNYYTTKSLNAMIRFYQRSDEEQERYRKRLFDRFARLKKRRLVKALIPAPWVRR